VIDSPPGPIHLVNWHLGLSESTRRWQANYLLEHPEFQASAHLPTVIVGDFNDWRNTLAHRLFVHYDLRQITHPLHRFRSFPAYLAVSALDKAFCCPQVQVHHASVVRSKLAKQASDHLPLVVDFRLTATSTASSLGSPRETWSQTNSAQPSPSNHRLKDL